MQNVQTKLQALEKDGICVFDDVLGHQQAERLRHQLLKHLDVSGRLYNGGNTQNDAINAIDGVQWIINETLLGEIVQLVAGEDAVYVHHSDALHNTFTGWHVDSIAYANSNKALDFWAEQDGRPYRVFKFAFYLQDHRNDNTALKYLRGSHMKSTPYSVWERIYHYFNYDTMQPAPGALVVFDQRLHHNGVTPSLLTKLMMKMVNNTAFRQKLWGMERRVRGMQDRVFMQIAFGAPGEFSNQHAMEMIDRAQQKTGAEVYRVSEKLKASLAAAGIGLADIGESSAEEAETETVVSE